MMGNEPVFACDFAFNAFWRVRRQAMLETFFARLRGRPVALLSYNAVREGIPAALEPVTLPGEQPVPLDAIVGSVGRFTDFTPSFRPRHSGLKSRWVRIRCRSGRSTPSPPVRLYQLGDHYFVVDGNHRVSVAREQGAAFVWARVTRLVVPPPRSTSAHPSLNARSPSRDQSKVQIGLTKGRTHLI